MVVVNNNEPKEIVRNYEASNCDDDEYLQTYGGYKQHINNNLTNNEALQDENDDDAFGDIENDNTPLINESNQVQIEDGSFPKARDIFGLMGFFGFAVVYAMRVNLSVAIVAMVNHTAIPQDNDSSIDNTCPEPIVNNVTKPLPDGDFVWDEATQGLVLGSFFYGYVMTQVPGGRMAELFGGKRIYGYGVLITVIFTLLTPIAAYYSLPCLIIVRILEGMGEGVTYPAMHAMLAHWIPPLERNKFAAIVYAGSNIGTVISMPLTGWLCSLKFMNGWPLAFYIFGLIGLIWYALWMYLVYDKPSVHPRISSKERRYIEQSIKEMIPTNHRGTHHIDCIDTIVSDNIEEENIPWRSIFTSIPIWAILITQCGGSWAFYTQLTELPTYMHNILHFDIQSNAVLNAVPYFTSWVVGIACSAIADWMLKRRYISTLNSYKLWNTVASIVPSLALLGVAYVGCSWIWVTIMLAGVGSFGGAVYAGNQMNHISLSPRFAGTLYGLTNSAANICGFLAPYVIGMIINHHNTMEQWRIVFWLAALLNIGGNFIYLIFASAEEQSWNNVNQSRTILIDSDNNSNVNSGEDDEDSAIASLPSTSSLPPLRI